MKSLVLRGATACDQNGLAQHLSLHVHQDYAEIQRAVQVFITSETKRLELETHPGAPSGAHAAEVNRVSVEQLRGRCLACGSTEHRRDTCRHKGDTCSNCSKTGHLARVCLQGKGKGKGSKGKGEARFEGECYNCGKTEGIEAETVAGEPTKRRQTSETPKD